MLRGIQVEKKNIPATDLWNRVNEKSNERWPKQIKQSRLAQKPRSTTNRRRETSD